MNVKEKFKHVKAFAFDVDGVFADENVLLNPNGQLLRSVSIKDGYALQYTIKQGYPVAIITGGTTESVRMRFQALGVTDIYLASTDKKDDFEDFIAKYDLKPEDVLYMGDDIPDYEVMQYVGIPTCPANAAQEIKNLAIYISDKDGGKGCVRDILEQVLKVQQKWLPNE